MLKVHSCFTSVLVATACFLSLQCAYPAFADSLEDGDAARKQGDFLRAFEIWKPLAEAGNSDAQQRIGSLYYNGKGMWQPNYEEALRWFKLSAAQGNTLALNNIGVLYDTGAGVKRDQIEAQRLFQTAADKGLAVAQFNVAVSYGQGWRGIEKNPAEAAKWFRLSADQGYAPAQDWLGDMYWMGVGVQRNYGTALTLYQGAARNEGWWLVQKKLGDIYSGKFSKEYAEKDLVKALMWYSLSPVLKTDAINLERYMPPDQINLAKGMADRCLKSNFKECG